MKNYKIKTLLLGLFMVVFSSAFAQKTITGSIQDGETSEPIIGATIQVAGTGAGRRLRFGRKLRSAASERKEHTDYIVCRL